jgi:serine/threonine protein kinase
MLPSQEEPQTKEFTFQLCGALAFLHLSGISHGDLKLEASIYLFPVINYISPVVSEYSSREPSHLPFGQVGGFRIGFYAGWAQKLSGTRSSWPASFNLLNHGSKVYPAETEAGYMPPEVYHRPAEEVKRRRVDSWSVGVIVLMMCVTCLSVEVALTSS